MLGYKLCNLMHYFTTHRDVPPVRTATLILSATDEAGRSTPSPGRFIPGEEHRYQLNRRLFGPQSWSGRFRKETNLLSVPEFEPRTVGPVVWSLYLLSCRGSLFPWTVLTSIFLMQRQYVYCEEELNISVLLIWVSGLQFSNFWYEKKC